MATTVFDVLNEKLTELKGSSEEFLTSGGPKDFAEYKEEGGMRCDSRSKRCIKRSRRPFA
jgi:hypothetical protein